MGRQVPPPHLDSAGDVLTLDADALSGRELELPIVVEQPAVIRVQREHHARHEARHKIGEAESERQQSHKEALPFVHREEVGPIEAAVDGLYSGGPSADECPKILQRFLQFFVSCALLSAPHQPAAHRRLQADYGGEDTREPKHVGRCSGLRREPRHVRSIERHRHVEVANSAGTWKSMQQGGVGDKGTPTDCLQKASKPALPRKVVGHLVVLGGDPLETEEEVADDLQDEEPLQQEVEALGARPTFDSGPLERLVVHLVLHELLSPSGALRLDTADHRVALQEVDGFLGGRGAIDPVVEGTPTRAPSAARVRFGARRVREDRGPFLEAVGGVVAAPVIGLQDVVEVLVVLPFFTRRAPLLPGHREANHEEEDIGEKAACARRHGEHGPLHAPRDGLPLP